MFCALYKQIEDLRALTSLYSVTSSAFYHYTTAARTQEVWAAQVQYILLKTTFDYSYIFVTSFPLRFQSSSSAPEFKMTTTTQGCSCSWSKCTASSLTGTAFELRIIIVGHSITGIITKRSNRQSSADKIKDLESYTPDISLNPLANYTRSPPITTLTTTPEHSISDMDRDIGNMKAASEILVARIECGPYKFSRLGVSCESTKSGLLRGNVRLAHVFGVSLQAS
jgi:hypothetical protein